MKASVKFAMWKYGRFIIRLFGLLLGLVFLVACIYPGLFCNTDAQYEFRQEFDQIESIEILRKQYDSINTDTPMDVIMTIEPSMYRETIDALLKIDCWRLGHEPGRGFGMYIIRITYKNGEMEMIGNYNNGYITPDGEIHQDIYAFDIKQYYAMISEILGREITDYYHH